MRPSTFRKEGSNLDSKNVEVLGASRVRDFYNLLEIHHNSEVSSCYEKPFRPSLARQGTIENGKKYQALLLQFIDTEWTRNFVVAVTSAWCKDGKFKPMFDMIKNLTKERTGFGRNERCGSCVADGNAPKVANLVQVEVRV